VGQIVRRWLFFLLLPFIVLAGALVALDFVAKDATQSAIADTVKKSIHAGHVSVQISSFPFLYDVVAEGKVDRVVVTSQGVTAGLVQLSEVKVDASHVRFNRHELVSHHTVQFTSISQATVTIVVQLTAAQNALASGLNAQVTSTASNDLIISAGGHSLPPIDLTRVPLIPACPLDVVHTGSSYTLTCTVSPVPSTVLAALSNVRA
jgi:hypothetical protein